MSGPLSHIRVLDLSRVLAGPWTGQILADLGADVIKVERPGEGDDTRGWGPPFAAGTDGPDSGDSGYFLCTNRGKKSIAVDLSTAEGRDLVRRLAARSDILLENFKTGRMAKFGLGYADLKAENAGLIYCSITGFGQTGPKRDVPGYDFVIQAMGGIMSVTGEADGNAGGGPQKVGIAMADIMTGMYAAVAVLGALAHRDRTGEGQYIDLALFDSLVASLSFHNMNYFLSGRVPERLGNAHPNLVPYQVFRAADEDLVVAVGNDAQFERFCRQIGAPALAEDPRYRKNRGRVENRDRLIPELAAIIAEKPAEEWLESLAAADIPCGPVRAIDQVLRDPQLDARDMIRELEGAAGPLKHVVNPIHYDGTPLDYDRAAPALGADTDAVLRDALGLDPEEIERLRRKGAIG